LVTSSGPSPVRGFIAAILHPLPRAHARFPGEPACLVPVLAAEPVSHNRVDPSPYYPVFGRRMVMIGYARRPIPGLFRDGTATSRAPSGPAQAARLRTIPCGPTNLKFTGKA
jgi:hypothetical protein